MTDWHCSIPKRDRKLNFLLPELKLCIHATPKAAATSIRNACLSVLGVHVAPEADEQREAWPHLVATEDIPRGYDIWTTVRHPVDRAVSTWANKVMDPRTRMNKAMRKAGMYKEMRFDAFVDVLVDRMPLDAHVWPQVELLPFTANQIWYEELPGGWAIFRKCYPAFPVLTQSNKTSPHYVDLAYQDRDSIGRLNDLYEKDLEVYGYQRR